MSRFRFLVITSCEHCPHLTAEEVPGYREDDPVALYRCALGGFRVRPSDLPLHPACPLPPAYLDSSGDLS